MKLLKSKICLNTLVPLIVIENQSKITIDVDFI